MATPQKGAIRTPLKHLFEKGAGLKKRPNISTVQSQPNNLSSGLCSASLIMRSNFSPILSSTAIEAAFSGDVMATIRGNRSTRLACARTAEADSTAYPFER
jgi:hypothetical protein